MTTTYNPRDVDTPDPSLTDYPHHRPDDQETQPLPYNPMKQIFGDFLKLNDPRHGDANDEMPF